jgi:hypothetical protein
LWIANLQAPFPSDYWVLRVFPIIYYRFGAKALKLAGPFTPAKDSADGRGQTWLSEIGLGRPGW